MAHPTNGIRVRMTRKRSASRNRSTETKARAASPVNQDGVGTAEDARVQPAREAEADQPQQPVLSLHDAGRQPAPVVAIEVDPLVRGGHVHDRLDVTIRGRATSTVLINEIRLQTGDYVTSLATFGEPDRAPAVELADGTPAREYNFQFNLPLPGDQQAETYGFQIIAVSEGQFKTAEYFEINVNPPPGDPLSVISGPTATLAGAAHPYAVIYIERATVDTAGVLAVQGWAVSALPASEVRILVGEAVFAARTGGTRHDVAAAFPAYPDAHLSGFSLTLPLDQGVRDIDRVCARLICPGGFITQESIPLERLPQPEPASGTSQAPSFSLLGQAPAYRLQAEFRIDDDPMFTLALPSPFRPRADGRSGSASKQEPSTEIRLYCDTAVLTGDGTLSLDGWAVCGIGIVQVRILLDNVLVGLASIGHERRDVGEIFPDIPMAVLSGFRFERRIADRFEGEHELRVVVRNMHDAEEQKQIPLVATEIAAPEPPPHSVMAPAPAAPELTPEQAAEFRFQLDAPAIVDGAAVEMVTGRLTIDGWLLTHSGIASFEVFLDDQRLGDAHHGLARQDVGTAFPEWPNSLRSGFAFHCPPRSLRDGVHSVELRVCANNGQTLTRAFAITVKKAEDQQDSTGIRRRVPRVEADMMTALLADMDHRPTCRFILRQDRLIDIDRLRRTFAALDLQAYTNWTVLVLVNDESVAAAMRHTIDDLVPHLANRFAVVTPMDTDQWAAPLAGHANGPAVLYSPLVEGDEPGADALLEFAVAAARHPGCELLYGDEVRVSPVSKEIEPFFKPDFSPDLLLATNYIGRPWAVTDALLARTGATPASLVADGEYDLVLHCAELAARVHHVPKLLCQRAAPELDDPARQRGALERALRRQAIAGQVLATPIPGTWRVKRAVPPGGKVSIIIPTCAAKGYIETCITTLRAKTAYQDYEVVCIDNIPRSHVAWKVWLQQNADKVVEIPDAFNWSVFNNRAAAVATGDFLLFLNDDIEIVQEDWLDAMMEHARRPEVGVTGPQLLYRDGKVQHAGMFLANNGIGRHAFRFAAGDDPCYFGLALTQRNVIAVTGACMLVRRDTFEWLGRFDEAHEIVNNDLDFCLRVHRAGLLTVFTPYASLIHHELASRASMKDVFDLTHFNAAWKTTFAAGDPYFNPRLSRHADDYRPDDEPVQWVVSGAPMFLPEEIQRILVVKLDHIGDFVTALPPIRRLKKLFPHARITVLAGPASRAFISLEPSIDEFIPFAFFHARSQLGERELTKQDHAELAEQLRPYHFDLAVDLRKHLSTRDILKCTGARFLAGFDYLGQFPFLDIALDWDGDRTLQRKRSHVIDDLMALVNAVGYASEADRVIMQPGPAAMPLTELPDPIQTLFDKPVVAIHPGAGNITKQWPEQHFSALIDLLVERNHVNVMLVGGPDEVDVANALVENVQNRQAIASMAGKTSLADLPRLLRNCALYIGNDSGPKHIAAAVGIPTVGIHSGVVDPVEWGPIGPNAVALRRNMHCSPCYLAKAEDCPRSLACLRFFEPNLVYETADLLLRRSASVGQAAPQDIADPSQSPETEAPPRQPVAIHFDPPGAPVQQPAAPEPKTGRRHRAAEAV